MSGPSRAQLVRERRRALVWEIRHMPHRREGSAMVRDLLTSDVPSWLDAMDARRLMAEIPQVGMDEVELLLADVAGQAGKVRPGATLRGLTDRQRSLIASEMAIRWEQR